MPTDRKNTLWIGVAKEKINPPPGVPLRGYPHGRPNTGIGLDLYARCAVFGNSSRRPAAALIALDTLHATADVVKEMRLAIAKRIPGLKPNAIMIAATHTHSAPAPHYFGDVLPATGKEIAPNRRYRAILVRGAVNAAAQGWKNPRCVTVRHGLVQAHLGHNRRVLVHGYARNIWEDKKREHTGYFNPDVNVIAFHDAATKDMFALIAGYGCHPVTLGGLSTKVSADYPGYYVAALEKATGAAMAMHITTGAGNINPLRCLRTNPRETKIMAKELTQTVLASVKRARPVKLKPISIRTAPLNFFLRVNMLPSLRKFLGSRGQGDRFGTEVQAIHFGDLALVSAPGELFAEIATSVRRKSPIKTTIIVEHTNDAASYIITDASTLEGAYEVCRGSISENMERPYVAAALKVLARK